MLTEYDQADMIGRCVGLIGTIEPGSYGHGFVGTLYDRQRPVKEDAAIIRRILRKASSEKGNPLEGFKVSVRYRTASMMQAIDIRITNPISHYRHEYVWTPELDPNAMCTGCALPHWKIAEFYRAEGFSRRVSADNMYPLSTTSEAARQYAERIQSAFNHDDSDMMTDYFDVKFYGQVEVDGG